MDLITRCSIVWALFLLSAHNVQSVTLVGRVGMKGVTGTVTLSQTTGDTTVAFSLTGLSNQQTWTFREIRTIYDVADKCSDSQLGAQVGTYTGVVPLVGTVSSTIVKADLDDLNSLTGRSVVLQDQTTSTRICATLEVEGSHRTAVAVFPATVAGHVVLRQLTSSSSAPTSMFADLYHVANTASAVQDSVMLKVCSGTLTADDTAVTLDNRCQNIGSEVQTLGSFNVGTTKASARKGLVLNNTALSGASTVLNKVIAIVASNGTIVSCATLRELTSREATTIISRDGVSGRFVFMQPSPYDATTVMVHLSNLRNLASGYHIHSWPVPQKLDKSEMVCDASHVSGHFNPYGVIVSSSPAAGTGTDDQYEIGDLSGKYGLLNNKDSVNDTYTDWNLPLFGTNSILGRSVVIHKLAGAARWVCSNVQYTGTMKIASIMFTYPVIGYIIFKQPKNNWYNTETQVYVELNYGDGTQSQTVNHKWHVHQYKVGNDSDANSDRCMSVSGHYNPYGVDLTGNYGTECSSGNPLRCEVGDLSGKHGKLSVRSATNGMQRAFFTDVDLPLSGPLSIVGKSVVIHEANNGGGRLSCANIYEVPERKVKVSKWYQNSASSVSGSVSMYENSQGALSGVTSVMFNLQSLAGQANGCHVHLYPVNESNAGPSPCSPASVGGHFIPYGWNISASPANGAGTDDQYEMGDLSGRYGSPLNGQTAYMGQFDDTNLPLRGPLSIVGRSVVIHKSDSSASRWVCGNIEEDSSTGGSLYQSKAVFQEGDIQGEIILRQYYYTGGGSSDTEIVVDLYHTATTGVTTNHNWHVHELQVDGDATSGCNSPLGHYNPFHANLTRGYSECSFSNPLRCELGDQASKSGQYDVGGGRRFYTDANLPIMGKYGVTGRSFVVHGPNSASGRVACADIMPVGMPSVQMSFPLQQNFDKNDLKAVLASAMNTDPWNIMTQQSTSSATSDGDCMQATVTMLGTDGNGLKTALENLVNNRNPQLGKYMPCSSASGLLSSVALVLMTLVFKQIIS